MDNGKIFTEVLCETSRLEECRKTVKGHDWGMGMNRHNSPPERASWKISTVEWILGADDWSEDGAPFNLSDFLLGKMGSMKFGKPHQQKSFLGAGLGTSCLGKKSVRRSPSRLDVWFSYRSMFNPLAEIATTTQSQCSPGVMTDTIWYSTGRASDAVDSASAGLSFPVALRQAPPSRSSLRIHFILQKCSALLNQSLISAVLPRLPLELRTVSRNMAHGEEQVRGWKGVRSIMGAVSVCSMKESPQKRPLNSWWTMRLVFNSFRARWKLPTIVCKS